MSDYFNYIEKKIKLNELKKNKHSEVVDRLVEVLSSDMDEEMIKKESDPTTFEERFYKFIKENKRG